MLELAFKLELLRDGASGPKTLRVQITNVGIRSIRAKVRVYFEYEYETPLDVSDEFQAPCGRIMRFEEIGRRISFRPIPNQPTSILPGSVRTYAMSSGLIPVIESVVAALSPERYRIVVQAHGQRETAISGAEFGGFIDAWAQQTLSGKLVCLGSK